MSEKQTITQEQFVKRLGNLCARGNLMGMPKSESDQHILMKSAMLMVSQAGSVSGSSSPSLSEGEVNEPLKQWVEVCQAQGLDHVMMRRALVDHGYLERSADGASYAISSEGPRGYAFEAGVAEVNVPETLKAAREEIEARKRAYMNQQKKS